MKQLAAILVAAAIHASVYSLMVWGFGAIAGLGYLFWAAAVGLADAPGMRSAFGLK
ncbi:hypothetical protein [Paracoccus sp. pheM1]|uniref:hypothetical protein n=1 Tax=Paracoccus sp. pheM1 TaxID=2831675 RepID=UPI001BDB85B3|nr:hypothetical protein [Paracoccus sp. pheM1]MBT0780560.1 hypothetical protein [Paracoccus sp. pheM1]